MACDRCGAVQASDGSTINAFFRTPNGQPLFVDVRLNASSDAARLHAVMFCADCWFFFLETFGQRSSSYRVTGE